jgi:hypothetical protein
MRGGVNGLMPDSAAGGNEAKLTNQPTGCKLEYRVKAVNKSGGKMSDKYGFGGFVNHKVIWRLRLQSYLFFLSTFGGIPPSLRDIYAPT